MKNLTRSRKGCWTVHMRTVFSMAMVVVLGSFMGGSLLAQNIMVDPTTIDFGKVLVGGSSAHSLMISNEGFEDLIVSSITVNNRAFEIDPTSLTLPADSSSSVSVTFTPGSEGEITGVLTVTSNDPDEGTVEVPLSGTGADIEATISVADGYGDPGTSGNKLSIMLDNTVDVAGLNFTLNFDPDILEPVDVVPGERTADMSIFNANLELGPGQAILVIADLEGDPISAGTGAIATFYFDVAAEAALGDYPVTLTDVVMADTEGQALLIDVADGDFHVTGPSGEAWNVSLTITSDDTTQVPIELVFGVHPNGTGGFDAGLDVPMAPPPPEQPFYAYFPIDAVLDKLSKDIRSSMVFDLLWFINTSNCGASGGTITWDPESLPEDATLGMSGVSSGQSVDMKETGSMTFGECEVFTITYSFEDQTPPADVTDLIGLAADGSAILMWTPSVSLDVRGYMIYVDSAGVRVDEIDAGDVATYAVMGLTNLAWYTFTVTAYDEVGNESAGVSVDVQPNPESFAIMLTLGSSEHDDTARVYFGGDPEGTDDFDAGLDYACPPPPPTPPELTAYFPIDHPSFDRLCTDVRSSLDSMVVWTLVIEGTGGEVCWNPDDLPSGFFILELSPGDEVDMKVESCADFAANDTVKIYFWQWDVPVEPYRELPTPERYILVQNYPNPFNPETTIEYQIPELQQIKLEIYNVLGQHVRTLVNAKQEAGYYSVVWNGLDNNGAPASSGVYFFRFQAGEYTMTKSMLLIK